MLLPGACHATRRPANTAHPQRLVGRLSHKGIAGDAASRADG